ncbi:MAG: plasmid pRiA4b ORF-3 family protein [Leptolyngbya sp. RL_3_1]|nr:plasmid pRiA4b ORF-3 family protein [Leptolyngbya sp. RL_3_1]
MQAKFDSVVALTDQFSAQHLNAEYAQLIRRAVAALARKRPSPLAKGYAKTWACGATHAMGMVNFLFDSSQPPYISAKDLYDWFGVASSTGQGKSKIVRDLLKTGPMDPDWCLPSQLDNNPMAWMIMVNGLILDARSLPRPIQIEAHAKGLIPYLPEAVGGFAGASSASTQGPASTAKTAKTPKTNPSKAANRHRLYVLEVGLLSGPITDDFIEANPAVSRVIEIQGKQTLAELHRCLFKAFDREEEHFYEFQVGGSGPNDPKARRYGLQRAASAGGALAGDVQHTAIADLDLAVDDIFGYWFDFGDDWWHQIDVLEVKDPVSSGRYPKIVSRIGASPPQYADWD